MRPTKFKRLIQPIERRDILHQAYLDDDGLEVYYSYNQLMRKFRMVIYWYVRDQFYIETSKGPREVSIKSLINGQKKGNIGEVNTVHSSCAILYFQAEGIPYEIVLLDGVKNRSCIFCITEKIAKVADTLKGNNMTSFLDKIASISVRTNTGLNTQTALDKQLLSDRVLFHINFSHFLTLPLQPARIRKNKDAGNNPNEGNNIDRKNNLFLTTC